MVGLDAGMHGRHEVRCAVARGSQAGRLRTATWDGDSSDWQARRWNWVKRKAEMQHVLLLETAAVCWWCSEALPADSC